MSRLGKLGAGLYKGEVAYDFIGKRKIWYTVSAALLARLDPALVFMKLTLGVEFKGGAVFPVPTTARSSQARTVGGAGVESSCRR